VGGSIESQPQTRSTIMHRKDYVAIANTIRPYYEACDNDQRDILDGLIRQLCNTFALDNPRFDAHRFNDACKGLK
jgi:hypothetical protein